jgi:hypothetical protein
MCKIIKISILTAILAIAVMGCKKDDPNKPTGNMQNVVLKGVVNDTYGKPLSGVKVITGTLDATTNDKGEFSFSQAEVIDKRAVIKFEKSGYFTLTRSREKQDDMFIDAVLYPKGNSEISLQTTFNTSDGKTMEVNGMKVKLSASSIMRADGSAYSGTVNANMLYLDPNNENFAGLMPGGDLMAIRENGSECMLISYGMTNVLFTDNAGNPLQLKSGSPATLTFPIPAGMENDAPTSMPLWHFDEEKGIWIEEGVATLQNGVYVGTVTHFSWVNVDVPKPQPVTLKGKVVDCENKPVSHVKVKVGQTSGYTDSNGEWSVFVPENTQVVVRVTANNGTDSKSMDGYPGGTTQIVPDLKVPCVGGGGGGEPGFTKIEIEKGCVVYENYSCYVYHQPCHPDSPLYEYDYLNYYAIFTFDNYGNRARMDKYSLSGEHRNVYICDAEVNNRAWMGSYWAGGFQIDHLWWNHEGDALYLPYVLIDATFYLSRTHDRYVDESKRFLSESSLTTTTDGKSFDVDTYKMKPDVVDWYDVHYYWKFGLWKGVLMYYRGSESHSGPGNNFNIYCHIASKIDTNPNIPSTAFDDPNLEVTWINW